MVNSFVKNEINKPGSDSWESFYSPHIAGVVWRLCTETCNLSSLPSKFFSLISSSWPAAWDPSPRSWPRCSLTCPRTTPRHWTGSSHWGWARRSICNALQSTNLSRELFLLLPSTSLIKTMKFLFLSAPLVYNLIFSLIEEIRWKSFWPGAQEKDY